MTSVDLPAYTVTRRPVKNLRLTVRPPRGEVRVIAPGHVSERTIAEFVAAKAEWIAKHRARLEGLPAPLEAGPEAERLRRDLRPRAQALLEYWADRMGAGPVPHLTIRRMSSRWGSCNPRTRRISLSLELARHDEELLEYVVVHELAHLFSAGHGEAFRAVMDRYLPDWRVKRSRLNGR